MKDYIYMVIGAICLGAVGIFIKLIGNDIHFMTLNFYRVFFAFIFLLITVPFIDKRTFNVKKEDLGGFFIIGLLLALALSTFGTAIVFAPIQNAVLIRYTYPFIVMLLAYLFLKEKINSVKIITLLIAIVGLAIINPFQIGKNNIGNILALLSAIFYAFLIIGMRKEDMNHTIGSAVWFFLFAALLLLPFPFIYGFGDLSTTGIFIILMGLATGIGHLFYNLALEKIEAEMCSIVATVVAPFTAIALAVLIIGEAIDWRVIVGGLLLITAGLYLETHNKKSC